MAYRSFRQFLDALEQAGELKRVTIPVDTELLIAEWADREMKSPGGGKALLFEQPIVMEKIGIPGRRLTPWDRAAAWRWRYRFPTLKMLRAKFSSS
jgi:3-polyprenyl-4-hydroxybenzoate decarboxylase and related decarboxylases